MPSDNYERYRKRLEDQLRTDMGLLYEAYLAKLRAFQAVEQLRGEVGKVEVGSPWEAELSAFLPPLAATAGPPVVLPEKPAQEEANYDVAEVVQAVLPELPEEFDRFDLLAALLATFHFKPRRSTLYSVLSELTRRGVLTIVREAGGKWPAIYRKGAAVSLPSPDA